MRTRTLQWLAAVLPVFLPQAGLGFDVSPVRQEIILNRGQDRSVEYVVTNTSGQAESIAIHAVEWRRYPWNRHIALQDWLEYPAATQRISLAPGEIKKVALTARCPNQASGELVAMIYFTSTQPDSPVQLKYGVSLYLLVKDTLRTGYALEQAGVRVLPWDRQAGSVTVNAEVTFINKSNFHLRPHIEGRLKNADLDFAVPFAFGQPVFPGEHIRYQGSACLAGPVPGGRYQMQFHVREDRLADAWVPGGEVEVKP